jgi:hypothetical protein
MKKLKLISKKEISRYTDKKVYDIEVADEHNYILENNIISHNSIGSFFPAKEVSGGGGIKYNSSIIMMLTKSKLTDKDSEDEVDAKGLDKHTKVGIVVTVNPIKQRFARPIKVQIHIPFYKKPNPYVGLEKFVSWENCGIIRGKCLAEKDYDKLSPKEKESCHSFETIVPKKLTKKDLESLSDKDKKNNVYEKDGNSYIDVKETVYAQPKDTARTLVCRHAGGEVPLGDLYTDKVFTEEILRDLDEKIIKPTFMLPSIESLEDLADVTEDLEGVEMDDAEEVI